jgi:hypothetical protein
MKFIVIPYIALGLVLSLAIGVEYKCGGPEVFPTYYGCPFIYKQESLGSTMEFYYSICGLFLNILTWSILLYFLDKWVQIINKAKSIRALYKIITGFLIIFTTLILVTDLQMIGIGFEENLNYWYWNIDNEAADWGVTCDGKLTILNLSL